MSRSFNKMEWKQRAGMLQRHPDKTSLADIVRRKVVYGA